MQLDLFKQPAAVYVFPLHRRADMVRQAAAALAARDYHAGQRFWGRHIRQRRDELTRAGLGPKDIKFNLERYTAAVGSALRQCLHRMPDDAA